MKKSEGFSLRLPQHVMELNGQVLLEVLEVLLEVLEVILGVLEVVLGVLGVVLGHEPSFS